MTILCKNHQTCARSALLWCIALISCFFMAAPIAAQTEIEIWGETIIVLPDDRMILQVDGKKYRLPSQADEVPAHPVDQIAVMHFGAAGDLEDLASSVQVKIRADARPFLKRNCFVYDHVMFPGFNVPVGFERDDIDHLQGCIVAAVSFGPGVKANKGALQAEDWNDRSVNRLSGSPPRIAWPDVEATPLTIEKAQEIVVTGKVMEGSYFVLEQSTGPEVSILFEMSGPLFGPGTRLMTCDAGYVEPKIFGHDCRIAALSEARGVFIRIRVFCPCTQDLEGLLAIDGVVTDRLRGFVR